MKSTPIWFYATGLTLDTSIDFAFSTRLSLSSQVKLQSKLEKLQEMVSQQFSVLLGVENGILKVYQNPPIKNRFYLNKVT